MITRNLSLTAIVAICAMTMLTHSAHAAVVEGDVISIDFGSTDPTTTNWNEFTYDGTANNTTVSDLKRLSDGAGTGVSIAITGLDGNGASHAQGSGSDQASIYGDHVFARGINNDATVVDDTLTFTISGLDDNLSYNLFGGFLRNSGNPQNFDHQWDVGGDIRTNDGGGGTVDGFETFNGVSSSGGQISFTITDLTDADFASIAELTISAVHGFQAGETIGVDFGTADGAETNWNPLASPGTNVDVGDLTDTDGNIVSGVGFETNAPGSNGTNDAAGISTAYPQLPDDAQDDWWFESGGGQWSFTFTGLDDGLTYDLIVGSYAPGPNQANRNTRWAVDGQTGDTDADDLINSYLSFSGLKTDGFGNLTISSQNIGGNGVSVVSTLLLTAIPTPSALPAGLAMLGLVAMRRRRMN